MCFSHIGAHMYDNNHHLPVRPEPLLLAISACLLGENVRYNGSNKHNNYIIGHLKQNLEILPVCPEMAIGLGVPRPPVQLVLKTRGIRCVGVTDKTLDVTDRLQQYTKHFLTQNPRLSGFILTSKSPSCGMKNTKLFDQHDELIRTDASGIFSATIMHYEPGMAIINDDQLETAQSKVAFFIRVYAYARLNQAINAIDPNTALKRLHANYLPLLRALSASLASDLDQQLQDGLNSNVEVLLSKYKVLFNDILSLTTSRQQLGESVLSLVLQQIGPDNTDSCNAAHQIFKSYIDAQSEWPEMVKKLDMLMDSARQNIQLHLQWLVPLSILG